MGKMHEICMIHSVFVEFSAYGQQSESIEAKMDDFFLTNILQIAA